MTGRVIRITASGAPLIVVIVWAVTRSPGAGAIAAVGVYIALGVVTGPVARLLKLPAWRPDVAYVTLLERWWHNRHNRSVKPRRRYQ